MSNGKASVLAPANQPLFEGQLVRNPTRVRIPPSDPYAGGGGDFPFQWSWPGVLAAPADGPQIYTATGFQPERMFVTFLVAPSSNIGLVVEYDGVFAFSQSVGASGIFTLSATAAPANTRIGLNVATTPGNGSGMWVGLTETT